MIFPPLAAVMHKVRKVALAADSWYGWGVAAVGTDVRRQGLHESRRCCSLDLVPSNNKLRTSVLEFRGSSRGMTERSPSVR